MHIKLACRLLGGILVLLAILVLSLFYMYQPVVSGTLHFEKASGTAEVLRETDTSIPHIYASSENMAMFT